MGYWRVPKAWIDGTAFCIGCGPSLQGVDLASVKRAGRVIVINDSFMLLPHADVLYFADEDWYERRKDRILERFCGQCLVTLDNRIPGVMTLQNTGAEGLEKLPTGLRHGHNSGYQAINLAYHFGVKRIILLGYDMRVPVGGMMRWNHRPEPDFSPDQYHNTLQHLFLPMFEHLKQPLEEAGVEVINCTPDSALKVWPYQPLESVLEKEKV